MSHTYNIALFASGTGSNVQSIINHFRHTNVVPAIIVTNNPEAGVLRIAENENIVSLIATSQEIASENFIERLRQLNINLVVLAGYLKKIPESLITSFSGRIINIHPALLPKYGGKGMYGIHVHKKVVEMQEKESGITVHYVNEHYDEGQIILQARCAVQTEDSPETVAQKVLKLEHFYFPRVIEFILNT